MNILKNIQTLLDNNFFDKNIKSYHLRAQNNEHDAYIVYRLMPSSNQIYGDGKALVYQYNFDFNMYYDKTDSFEMFAHAENLQKILLENGYRLLNGISDLADMDTDLRGFNISVSYSKGVAND